MTRSKPNLRVVVQGKNKDLVTFVIAYLQKGFEDEILFEVGIKENTREPFIGGVHNQLFMHCMGDEQR